MTHMSMFPGNREIIEIEEELNPGEHYRSNSFMKPDMRRDEKDRRSLASNSGTVSSLEEDLNQLFEIFNRRASSHGSSHQNQAGTSKRNTSKKSAKGGSSPSLGHGISESMNLKKALRGLCLSQASEMAAMKRSMKSPRSSEAGRIMTMYRNVVVEDIISDHSVEDSRGGMLEISLVPEQSTFDSFQNVPEKLPATDLWPSNRSSLGEKALSPTIIQNDRIFESKESGNQMKKQEKPAGGMISSFSHANDNIPNMRQGILTQENGNQSPGNEMRQKQKLILPLPSSSPTVRRNIREVVKTTTRENGKSSAPVEHASQASLAESIQNGMRASPTSSSHSTYARSTFELANKMPVRKDSPVSSVEAGNYISQVDMLHQEEHAYPPSSVDFCDITWEDSNSRMIENGKFSSSAACSSQLSSTESSYNEKNEGSSRASCGKTYLDNSRNLAEQKERICVSPVVQSQKKINIASKDEHAPTRSPRRSDLGETFDHGKNSPAPPKVVGKEASGISANVEIKESGKKVKRDTVKTISSTGSQKGKKVSRSARNAQHFVKPLIKTKNFVKRRSKKKMASVSSSKNVRSEFNNDLYSSPNPIVCPNCQCVVTDAWKESNKGSSVSHQDSPISPQESPVSHHESPAFYQDSPMSPFASLSGEVSSGNVISDLSTPAPSCNGLNKSKTILVDSSSNSKTRDKAEFTQSSKSSPGECSTSTSVSEESNLSRPSVCDRPHMSKDVRWEAIRHIRFQHGSLGLRNFSLLKKLGCGDIGTVYLAELIGTNCQFAIKVMDNEFLARRKKTSRAQTEKEILRMLDHPFLPTLYCQFTSDNLSCLVMEYCPGGDLHVLRQRQPGKCFTEQAARFYVAEVLLALEYLHMLGVVYRDLKPENILVREDGHIMLSDFDLSLRCAVSPTLLVSSSMSEGSRKVSHDSRPCTDSRCAQPLCIEPSCQVTCFTPRLKASSSKLRKMKSDVAAEMRPLLQLVAEPTTARSNSFVGTHEYLAPEIIKGEGHGSAVDWWTYGIFLYELLYGKTPFKGAGNEDTLANVVLQSLKFPDSPLVSLQARDLIAVLLVKEPENRLGTERGAAEIKQHPFFDGLNWALIRCAVPPELPESRSYGMPKEVFSENSNNYMEYSSGSGSVEHLEFEVF